MIVFVTRAALFASGALLCAIGGALLTAPTTVLAMSDVLVPRDPGLTSELAAPSGILLITGALMLTGAIRFRVANQALLVGAVVYGTYGAGRLVSMALHGMPPQSLIAATGLEIAVAIALVALRQIGTSPGRSANELQSIAARQPSSPPNIRTRTS